jgi:hypothetical protein
METGGVAIVRQQQVSWAAEFKVLRKKRTPEKNKQ